MKKLIFLVVCLIFSPLFGLEKKHNLSICAIFKNEAPFLKEWIEYHRLIGVDHFYLYNIGSTDLYNKILRGYIKEGLVTCINWPEISKHQGDDHWPLQTQIPAYENAAKYAALGKTKWLVCVDIDEFLLPIECENLTELLEKYKSYPGIVLSRVFFDASRMDRLPKRNLIIESVEMTAPPKINLCRTVEKIIFKPELSSYFTWPPYQVMFKDGQIPIKLSQWEMRINRYMNRNGRWINSEKYKGVIQMDWKSFEYEASGLLEAGYQIEDRLIERFVPNVRKKMGM